jgi:hypothetical protein
VSSVMRLGACHDRGRWKKPVEDQEGKQGAAAASVSGLSPHSLAPSI